MRQLRANRHRQARTHRALTTGGDELPAILQRHILTGPHLVVTHLRGIGHLLPCPRYLLLDHLVQHF